MTPRMAPPMVGRTILPAETKTWTIVPTILTNAEEGEGWENEKFGLDPPRGKTDNSRVRCCRFRKKSSLTIAVPYGVGFNNECDSECDLLVGC
mmetsp:Transcript_7990/g.15779  ORF Transcript_7990/g.15779 Transcript_7990/m.15779 type:complete len:93 (-) Transcript_7990:325-603(-)